MKTYRLNYKFTNRQYGGTVLVERDIAAHDADEAMEDLLSAWPEEQYIAECLSVEVVA
jgi:hypothetical protein